MKAQEHLDEYLENQMGPSMWMGCNPSYRLENKMDSTQFRDTFKGQRDEPVDKVYFRKQDQVSAYAEAMFKSSILMTKK